MRALVVEADWLPREGYQVSKEEESTRETFHGNQVWKNPKMSIQDIERPILETDEVLIKVKACGICGSDIHFHETDNEGYILFPGHSTFPLIIGHEYSGVIEEVGSKAKGFKVGDKITSEGMWWCGECDCCRAGFPNHCKNLKELGFSENGAFAEYTKVKAKYCWKINDLSQIYKDEKELFKVGALIEPFAVAYNGIFVRGGGFRPGSYIVVYGAGTIGLASIQLCKASGAASIICFEKIKERKELAKKCGANFVFDPTKVDPVEKVKEITKGKGSDFQIEAAGAPRVTIPLMENSLAVNGKIIILGIVSGKSEIETWKYQTNRNNLIGSQGSSGHNIWPYVIRMIANGKINPTIIISASYNLENIVDGFLKAETRKVGKVLIII
jgi:threonine dehydrogenase-like Zn-dependent dehydrogenase